MVNLCDNYNRVFGGSDNNTQVMRGRRSHNLMVVGFITTYAVSTTKVVSSSPTQARCTRYNIVIKFVSDLRVGRWFSPDTPVSSTNKIDHHEILLKVVLVKHHKKIIGILY